MNKRKRGVDHMTIYELITVIVSGCALILAIISISLASKAINIEERRDKIELEKGQYALLNLTSRYFILNYHRTEFTDTKFKVKTDPYVIDNYVKELELLASQFDDLMDSPFYTQLYKNYSIVGSMPVFMRKEIMFIKLAQSKKQPYGYDHDVWQNMYTTFETMINQLQPEQNLHIEESLQLIKDMQKYAKSVNNYHSSQKKQTENQ